MKPNIFVTSFIFLWLFIQVFSGSIEADAASKKKPSLKTAANAVKATNKLKKKESTGLVDPSLIAKKRKKPLTTPLEESLDSVSSDDTSSATSSDEIRPVADLTAEEKKATADFNALTKTQRGGDIGTAYNNYIKLNKALIKLINTYNAGDTKTKAKAAADGDDALGDISSMMQE
jgi:hypothetical protein